ncbi:hypothetical protein [Methylobacterium sp. J-077]|uniref:hypothetical protein n=1 Tax=Methylobacterium sp. J-077 TaxID=2836656 RepID=UPI001FBBFEDF|nr:hypothetical protein [Methylobacterium sp. J-077]MCJ2123545.1 hypothetical protein [Methylobacterium sp. J-077]
MELWPGAAYVVDTTCVAATLGFAFEGQHGIDAIDTGRRRPFRRRINSLAWIPPGCPVYSQSDRGGEYLVIQAVPPERIGHADAGQRPVTNVFGADAVAVAYRIRLAVLTGDTVGCAAAVDHLCACLLDWFFRGRDPSHDWLTDRRLAAVDRYLDRHMHESICIADWRPNWTSRSASSCWPSARRSA